MSSVQLATERGTIQRPVYR